MKNSIFNNIWVVRGVSLLFALFLYVFVTAENSDQFQVMSNQQFASVETSETISNVPVYLGEHDEGVFVSGLPESVQVRLSGPRNIITQVTVESFVVQTEEITGIASGTHTVRLTATGLPEEVDYQITPARVVVQIASRETVTVPIEYVVDDNVAASGYQVSQVTLGATEVTLTGKEATMAEIEQVLVRITQETPQTANFSQAYRLQILDSEGQLLDINADLTEIEAHIEITPQQKEVPLTITPYGENLDQYSYSYAFSTDVSSALAHADQAVLDQLEFIPVVVDVSNVTDSRAVTGTLELPEGVIGANIQQIEVAVEVTPLEVESEPESEIVPESSTPETSVEEVASEESSAEPTSEENPEE